MNRFTALLTAGMMALPAHAGYLSNFDEPNTQHLIQALDQRRIHIVQLGDSHTAGDIMTNALRNRLQFILGDGGMGWAMPMYFKGQRLSRFGYDNTQFSPVFSRTNTDENYTLGGMIAKPLSDGATLTLKNKQPEAAQKITISIRQQPGDGHFSSIDADGRTAIIEAPRKDGTWQTTTITATLPITLRSEQAWQSAIGGWWAFNPHGEGATVSAIGINGSELAHWERWNNSAWQNELRTIAPQLVVLAYGTNEAYNNVAADTVKNVLSQRIEQIRATLPQAAIMIISAPEALKKTAGSCGTRPANLSEIQAAQRETAQRYHTLYWDWQSAMGGSCSMKSWIAEGKASRDGVHFSSSGYTELGNQLADDLLDLSRNPKPSAEWRW